MGLFTPGFTSTKEHNQMDLTTTYMGLKLAHPLVPSASPLSYTIAGIRQLEDAGAAARGHAFALRGTDRG